MIPNLYHGAFCKFGPTVITVNGDVTDSKFKKAGMPNKFVNIILAGTEYALNLENEAVVNFFTGLNGRTMKVEGKGKAASAEVVYLEECERSTAPATPPVTAPAAPKPTPPQPASKPAPTVPNGGTPASNPRYAPPTVMPPPQSAAGTRTPEQALKVIRRHIGMNLAVSTIALQAMMTKAIEFEVTFGFPMPEAVMAELFAALLFRVNANDATAQLPGKITLHPIPTATEPAPAE